MAYATAAELVEWLRLPNDSRLDASEVQARTAAANVVLEAVTEAIDSHTSRSFDDVTESRTLYPGWGTWTLLDVGDCRAVTSVTVDGEALASTSWRLRPLAPRSTLRYLERRDGRNWAADSEVVVAGDWGFVDVPHAVEQACLMWAARTWQRAGSPLGTLIKEDIALHVRKADPDVALLLEPYTLTPVA